MHLQKQKWKKGDRIRLIQLRGIIDDINDLPTTKPILNRIDKFKNMFWVASQRKKETGSCQLK